MRSSGPMPPFWDRGFSFPNTGRVALKSPEMLPNLARVVDDICLIKSMQTDQFNHAPAQIFLVDRLFPAGPSERWIVGAFTVSDRKHRSFRLL